MGRRRNPHCQSRRDDGTGACAHQQIKPPAKVQTGVSEIAVRRETPTEFVMIGCSIDAAHPTPVYAQDAVGSWLFCAARWCHCSALSHWGY